MASYQWSRASYTRRLPISFPFLSTCVGGLCQEGRQQAILLQHPRRPPRGRGLPGLRTLAAHLHPALILHPWVARAYMVWNPKSSVLGGGRWPLYSDFLMAFGPKGLFYDSKWTISSLLAILINAMFCTIRVSLVFCARKILGHQKSVMFKKKDWSWWVSEIEPKKLVRAL